MASSTSATRSATSYIIEATDGRKARTRRSSEPLREGRKDANQYLREDDKGKHLKLTSFRRMMRGAKRNHEYVHGEKSIILLQSSVPHLEARFRNWRWTSVLWLVLLWTGVVEV